jgi:hypothetical protein
MDGEIATKSVGPKDPGHGHSLRVAWTAILLLSVFAAGCLEETDDCIQHVNMDSNGAIFYTFEGESCGEVLYPPTQTPVMVQFGESYLANTGKAKDVN